MDINLRHSRKKLLVNIRPRNKPNYVFPPAYNYSQHKQSWDIVLEKASNRTITGNQSALQAKNDFFTKSHVLSDMRTNTVQSHSFMTVIVISSMFLFFTISLTAAVIVFCRKKNTVFALQKCEEEDDADDEQEYELDDLNTDVESDYEGESRRPSHQTVESPIHQPVGTLGAPGTYDSDPENDYSRRLLHAGGDAKHYNYSSTAGHDQRGMYQRMVVTAVLENQHLQRENPEQQHEGENRTTLRDKIQKKYHDFAQLTHSDIETDFSAYPMTGNMPAISVSYADDPPSYDSLSYHGEDTHLPPHLGKNTPFQKIPYVELTEIPVQEQCNSCKSCNVFVSIPDSSSASIPRGSDSTVLFVNLPPKKSTRASSSSLSTSSTSSSISSIESNPQHMDTIAVTHSLSLPATPMDAPSSVVGQRLATGSNQWASCTSISTTLDAAATGASSWSELPPPSPSPLPARRPCTISFTRESGIADLVSPGTVTTPISPPPGFRNDDCFLTPSSSAGDSGVMVATV